MLRLIVSVNASSVVGNIVCRCWYDVILLTSVSTFKGTWSDLQLFAGTMHDPFVYFLGFDNFILTFYCSLCDLN